MKHLNWILILLLFSACSDNENKERSPEEEKEMKELHEMSPAEAVTGTSIYNLTSEWVTQQEDTIPLRELRGKVQVMALVYTTCDFACPRILADMQRIQKGIPGEIEDEVNFLIVSIDPDVDTPEKLRAYATENDMNAESWTLLHGQKDDILELAALLGVKYKKTTETDYAHSNIITILNKEGEIVHQQTGLNQTPDEVVKVIDQILSE